MPRYEPLALAGAWTVRMEPNADARGWFARYFCAAEFEDRGPPLRFVQFNHSATRRRGSIRGMHLQIGAAAEDKFVKCIRGAVADVLLDLRVGSPTLLRHVRVDLSAANGAAVFIPRGVAHGFQTLEDDTELIYHHSNYYSPPDERGVRFDDPAAGIDWPMSPTESSDKDRFWPLLARDFAGFSIS